MYRNIGHIWFKKTQNKYVKIVIYSLIWNIDVEKCKLICNYKQIVEKNWKLSFVM
jgi:hypothetical protein